MCEFGEYQFTCGHVDYGLVAHCHRRRNSPNRICRSVKTLTKEWPQDRECDNCVEAHRRHREQLAYQQWLEHQQRLAQAQAQGQGGGSGQGQGQGQGQ